MRMKQFEGKVAIVTGGSSGVGKATCIELAKRGASVVVSGRREKECLETLEVIKEVGGNGIFIQCDISDGIQVKNLVYQTVVKFGKLDLAINNAGYFGVNSSLTEYPEDIYEKVINTNLKGTFLCLKYELQEMAKSGGSIVNIASVNGLVSMPYGVGPYAASKHAIVGLTKTAALEFASKKIRVNAICPAIIETEMMSEIFNASPNPEKAKRNMDMAHPMQRMCKPEEVAKSAVWLCSDEASFITGVALPVDGGWTAQ